MLKGTLKELSNLLNFAPAAIAKKRQILIDLHGERCFYCGESLGYYEVDHVHPRSRGGDDTLTNLVLSCVRCNQTKGQCGINNMGDKPRWLKEAVLRTLRILNSNRKFTYIPSKTYFHLNGDAPISDVSDITEFGELIERQRVANSLTKKGIIKRLNCYEKKWNNYLTRRTIFGESQLPRLAKLLWIPLDTLKHAYMSDVFEYALERHTLSQVWKKDFLQAFIDRCDIENRFHRFLVRNPKQIKPISSIYQVVKNLKIGRPPGKKGRDQVKKELGFEVFPPETVEAFRKELHYELPPLKVREVEHPYADKPIEIKPPLKLSPEEREKKEKIRQRKIESQRAKTSLNGDLSNCRTEFGKALRTARIKKGWSQSVLGEKIGVDKISVQQWETTLRLPYPVTAYRLKNALNLPDSVMPAIDTSMCQTERGKQIREHRIKKGWNLKQAAKEIGVHKGTLWLWECSDTQPLRKHHRKIAAVLDIPIAVFQSQRRRWTSSDSAALKDYASKGWCPQRIAKELGRSESSVYSKAREIGIPFSHKGKRTYWTNAETKQLRQYVELGNLTDAEIAAELGRSLNAIDRKRKRMKLPKIFATSASDPELLAKILEYKDQGWSHERIGAVFGVSVSRISNILTQNGFKGYGDTRYRRKSERRLLVKSGFTPSSEPTYYPPKPPPRILPSKTPPVVFRPETKRLFSECERQIRIGKMDVEIAENLRCSEEFVKRQRKFVAWQKEYGALNGVRDKESSHETHVH
ncbi:hypothetical protein C6503_19495 [Candidatus Poribacteria bacterium]|nr:MAG: hypothetical protein C6503_19495 [Candidatus Poribacteria bacterium]